MPEKIIAKISTFVILAAGVCVVSSGCIKAPINADERESVSQYLPPKVVGTINSKEIEEGSGIAASRCTSNVLWTHNDSGDAAYLFAISTTGELLGTWRIPNAENNDWEDIATSKDASGKCLIYVGDIGDNKGKHTEHAVYRISEPAISPGDRSSYRKRLLTSDNAQIIRFRYPDSSQNAETLMVHPSTGDIYVVTKREAGPARVYCLRQPVFDGSRVDLERVADIFVPAIPNGFVTGGDIAPDGRRLVICDYTQGYEWTLPRDDSNFDDIWKQQPEVVDLGKRKHGESICYSVDGTSLFATSEGVNSPVIEIRRRQ